MSILTHHTAMTLTLCGYETELDAEIKYEYFKPSRGARERGSGIQLEPDEPASVEIHDVLADGRSIFDLLIEESLDAISSEILAEYE